MKETQPDSRFYREPVKGANRQLGQGKALRSCEISSGLEKIRPIRVEPRETTSRPWLVARDERFF
ncbi:hypothetical protein [Phosphitispora sp. TUW77]|uniref:hypothetical protein n=1 Tax=Phosphitispora sp. TUW77 TaxID=3152361 RepID=UPI003AB5309C